MGIVGCNSFPVYIPLGLSYNTDQIHGQHQTCQNEMSQPLALANHTVIGNYRNEKVLSEQGEASADHFVQTDR